MLLLCLDRLSVRESVSWSSRRTICSSAWRRRCARWMLPTPRSCRTLWLLTTSETLSASPGPFHLCLFCRRFPPDHCTHKYPSLLQKSGQLSFIIEVCNQTEHSFPVKQLLSLKLCITSSLTRTHMYIILASVDGARWSACSPSVSHCAFGAASTTSAGTVLL